MANNRYLLDTHALIWFQKNNPKLSKRAASIIEDTTNIVLFSQINLFELAIKQKVGKMPEFLVSGKEVFDQGISDGFLFISIKNNHIFRYSQVELFDNHRDPFDRLLIASAIEENAIILSGDDKFKLYEDLVKVIW